MNLNIYNLTTPKILKMVSPKNIDSRIRKARALGQKIFNTKKNICNTIFEDGRVIHISSDTFNIKYLSRGSEGIIYKVCNDKNKLCMVVKIMDVSTENKHEIDILNKCKKIIERKYTQNVPYAIFDKQCVIMGQEKIIIASELANEDLESWLKSKKRTLNEIKSAIFQLYSGIYFFHKILKKSQADFNLGNALVHRTETRVGKHHWVYNINNVKYYVPYGNDLFTLWDFGKIANLKSSIKETGNLPKHDYKEIIENILVEIENEQIKSSISVIHFLQRVLKPFKSIKPTGGLFVEPDFTELFPEYTIKPKNSIEIEEFNINNKY